jgi:hypothetical protein
VYQLQSSPLIKLAIMMVNILTGNSITPLTDKAEYERLKAQAVSTPPT